MSTPVEISYLLTRRDKAQLFFYAYYSYPKWGWVRSLGGPVTAVSGALVMTTWSGWLQTVGGLLIGSGIWYSIKPVLHFLKTRKRQVDTRETVSYSPDTDTLDFRSNQARLEIPSRDLQGIKKAPFGKSLIIRMEDRLTRIFIPRPRIIEGSYDEFIAAMEELLRRNGPKKENL
jgi:hypothetical protein